MGGKYIETVEIDVTCNGYEECSQKGIDCLFCIRNVYHDDLSYYKNADCFVG